MVIAHMVGCYSLHSIEMEGVQLETRVLLFLDSRVPADSRVQKSLSSILRRPGITPFYIKKNFILHYFTQLTTHNVPVKAILSDKTLSNRCSLPLTDRC